jgi:hypothetical protein
MSATGRGKVREKFDFYPTPSWATRAFLNTGVLDEHFKKGALWLEPAAGQCAIVDAVNDYADELGLVKPRWVLYDIDKRHKTMMESRGRSSISDFVLGAKGAWTMQHRVAWSDDKPYDVLITNPPFEMAEDFLWQGGQLAKIVVMLLRVGFLGSQSRDRLFKNTGIPDTYLLNKRPSFGTDKNGKPGTDASEYAWFVWDSGSLNFAGSLRRLSCQDDT